MGTNIAEDHRLTFEIMIFPISATDTVMGLNQQIIQVIKGSKIRKRHVIGSSDSKILHENPEGKGMQIDLRENMDKYAFLGLAVTVFCL